MKLSKILTLSAAFMLMSISMSASAQKYASKSKYDAKDVAQERMEELDAVVKLSNSKETKAYNIYLKYAEEMVAELEKSKKSNDKNEIQKILNRQANATDTDIKAILTTSQKKLYESNFCTTTSTTSNQITGGDSKTNNNSSTSKNEITNNNNNTNNNNKKK
ncbi:MAG: hypothetical protein R3Y61_01515 [Rikenellaceae bacterium]